MFDGRLCRSRARFWASAQMRAASAASATPSGPTRVSDSIRGAGGSAGSLLLSRSKR